MSSSTIDKSFAKAPVSVALLSAIAAEEEDGRSPCGIERVQLAIDEKAQTFKAEATNGKMAAILTGRLPAIGEGRFPDIAAAVPNSPPQTTGEK